MIVLNTFSPPSEDDEERSQDTDMRVSGGVDSILHSDRC